MTPRRGFLVALVVSVALHLLALTGGARLWPALAGFLEAEVAPPLEARLLEPRRPASAPARPAAKRPRPGPRVPDARPVEPPAEVPIGAVPSPEAPPVAAPLAATDPAPEADPGGAPAEVVEADAAAAAETPAVPFALPRKVRIHYVIQMGEGGLVIGEAHHDWQHDGLRYQLRSVAETSGLAALLKPARVVHTSEGTLVGGDPRPLTFRVEKNGNAGDWARFDWPAGRVTLSGGEREATLEAGAQDMVSMFAHLAVIRLDPEAVVSFPVVTGKKIEIYDFAVVDQVRINTPLGERPTLHLRNRRAGGDSTELWLAADLPARLPLRIRHVDRHGIVFDQVADLMEFETSAPQEP